MRETLRSTTVIRVDGERVGDGPVSWKVHRFVDAYFSADAAAVADLLPSQLHPFRWSPHRTMVSVMAAHWEWRVGSVTVCRSGDLGLTAMVTRGDTPAAPLLPALRGLRVGGRHDRFLGGSFPLLVASTNRIARELWNRLLGVPGFVADLRYELGPTFDRFVCEESDRLVADLTVSSTGRAGAFSSSKERGFGIRNGTLIGVYNDSHGTARSRYGRSSAELKLGSHPVTETFRNLKLSARPIASGVWLEGEQRMMDAVRVFGPAAPRTGVYTGSQILVGRLIAGRMPDEAEIDQGLAHLPFDPAGEVTVEPVERVLVG